jgi:hypothetical protein
LIFCRIRAVFGLSYLSGRSTIFVIIIQKKDLSGGIRGGKRDVKVYLKF